MNQAELRTDKHLLPLMFTLAKGDSGALKPVVKLEIKDPRYYTPCTTV